MGIEEQIDRLIDLGEDIKSRLDLLVKMASDHFAGANKMVNFSEIPNSSSAESIIVQFGTGRIAVIRIEEKAENLISCGLVIRDSGSEHEIGSPVPGCSGEYKPKNGDIYLRFSNVESLQVVIEELETCKKLFESQAKETDAIACDHHICELAKPTGITCPPDSCDIDDGVRELPPADHFADANKMVADEPAKKWRRLTDEFVQPGDWANAKVNRQDVDPPEGGWIPAEPFYFGKRACTLSMYFARPVADEPAKEPEHPAGPMPDPGEEYRILSKDPPEDLNPNAEWWDVNEDRWCGIFPTNTTAQHPRVWYRRKIEPAKPAWEPKVGDWVKVTRPSDWNGWVAPLWQVDMNRFHGRVGQIENQLPYGFTIRGFYGKCGFLLRWHRDWLTPAEPPAIDKPPEPEYRQPVLPADAGKECEFSDDSMSWEEGVLIGWRANFNTFNWKSERDSHRYARIKKDA